MRRLVALLALAAGLSIASPSAHAVQSDVEGPCYTPVIQVGPDGDRQIIVIRVPCP